MKVLFVASDNDPTSGAFLSMIKLNVLLRDIYSVETKIVLPCVGEGKNLLDENNLPYVLIPSKDWVVEHWRLKNKPKAFLRNIRDRFQDLKSISKIAALIAADHYDIVHINTAYAYVGAVAARRENVPVVWHIREMLEEDQHRSIYNRKRGYRFIAKSDCVIAISSAVYKKYKKWMPDANMVRIFNGIDINKFYNPRKEILKEPNRITFIYGGGYPREKGVYELADAFQLLVNRGMNDFSILMLGIVENEYMDYLKKTELLPFIQFLGYQKNVEDWYEKADVAFSCSFMEAFGRKTVEAMLCGCLMIASNTGGSLDIIDDGKTGLLYQQGSAVSLADRIQWAVKHIEEARNIAACGRDYARDHFSAEENAKNVYSIYKKIVRKNRG